MKGKIDATDLLDLIDDQDLIDYIANFHKTNLEQCADIVFENLDFKEYANKKGYIEE